MTLCLENGFVGFQDLLVRQPAERDAAADVTRSRRRRLLLQGDERRRQRRLRQHVVVVAQNDVRSSPRPGRMPVVSGQWRRTT